MPTPLYSGVGNPWTSRFVCGKTQYKSQSPQEREDEIDRTQAHAEIALKRKLDCRKLGGDAETLDAELKGLSSKLWSLHPIEVHN